MTLQAEAAPLVSLADITEIELVILQRMREVTLGDHRSRSHGSGFDFVGLREWQAGDKFSAIDWGQSSLTNFAPLVVREFEQPSTATVMAVADQSLSTRCGADGRPIAAPVARALATIGMSAVFFQDPFGLLTFDTGFAHLSSIRPRTGKGHVVHCLDAYQTGRGLDPVRRIGSLADTLGGYLRRPSLMPIISDFLFEDAPEVLKDISMVSGLHDVFIVLIDSTFAFEFPAVSAGWANAVDVETGRPRTLSRRTLTSLTDHVRRWQDTVRLAARDFDLDVVDVGIDHDRSDIALSEFVAERRLRKTRT
jgi:uncharacterized protein (DUF58 family)